MASLPWQQSLRSSLHQASLPSQQRRHLLLHRSHHGHQYREVGNSHDGGWRCCSSRWFRYTSVCHPLYYRDSLTLRSVTSRVLMYVIPVIVVSSIINIPKLLELELVYEEGESLDNVTRSSISYDLSELRQDPDYIRYIDFLCFVWNKSIKICPDTTRTGVESSSPASYREPPSPSSTPRYSSE